MLSQSFSALVTIVAAASSLTLAQPLKRDATIACQDKGDATSFYYGDPSYGYGGGLVGLLDGKLTYDTQDVDTVSFQVQSSICNSTALGLSAVNHEGSNYGDPDPIKLYIVDQPGKCLALSSTTQANTTVVFADCSDEDTVDAQATQFWLQAYKYKSIVPYGSNGTNSNWILAKADTGSEYIIANPYACFPGETCQTDNRVSLSQSN
jgi:hypothetical protein